MTQYVGIIQQGLVSGQKAIVTGTEPGMIERQVAEAVQKLNDAQKGFGDAWTWAVLPVEQEDY